jgi:hypothetical protein
MIAILFFVIAFASVLNVFRRWYRDEEDIQAFMGALVFLLAAGLGVVILTGPCN